MNAELYQITREQFRELAVPTDVEDAAAELASEIIVGMLGGRPLVFIGLCPRTILGNSAYVWMITTHFGFAHPRVLARRASEVLNTILSRYDRIDGHCFDPKSQRWLHALGAGFTEPTRFEFRRG